MNQLMETILSAYFIIIYKLGLVPLVIVFQLYKQLLKNGEFLYNYYEAGSIIIFFLFMSCHRWNSADSPGEGIHIAGMISIKRSVQVAPCWG